MAFTVLLNMKHLFVCMAPVFFVWILTNYCIGNELIQQLHDYALFREKQYQQYDFKSFQGCQFCSNRIFHIPGSYLLLGLLHFFNLCFFRISFSKCYPVSFLLVAVFAMLTGHLIGGHYTMSQISSFCYWVCHLLYNSSFITMYMSCLKMHATMITYGFRKNTFISIGKSKFVRISVTETGHSCDAEQ